MPLKEKFDMMVDFFIWIPLLVIAAMIGLAGGLIFGGYGMFTDMLHDIFETQDLNDK